MSPLYSKDSRWCPLKVFSKSQVVVESLRKFKINCIDPGERLELTLPCLSMARSMKPLLPLIFSRHVPINSLSAVLIGMTRPKDCWSAFDFLRCSIGLKSFPTSKSSNLNAQSSYHGASSRSLIAVELDCIPFRSSSNSKRYELPV